MTEFLLEMDFTPVNYYDPSTKIWRGDQMTSYFDERLSIGQIIYHEMRRHPQLIAQVSTVGLEEIYIFLKYF